MTDNLSGIKKQIQFLAIFAIVASFLLIVSIFFIFKLWNRASAVNVEELTAKRINIIEPNGQVRLVISNKEKSPENLAYGKPIGIPGGNRPGIIFFNDEATECGGLVFSGRKDTIDGKYFASGHFSFDQYNQNQVLYFQYLDDNGERKTGLYVDDWHNSPDFPEFRRQYKAVEKLPAGPDRDARLKEMLEPADGDPAFAHRVFVGRDEAKSALINLSDERGKVRIQLKVDSAGEARINFLNDSGKVIYRLPDSSKK